MKRAERKNKKSSFTESTASLVVAVLFVLLLALTVVMILMIGRSTTVTDRDVFDLERITSEQQTVEVDAARHLLPEFIGITLDGNRSGVSNSVNILTELYSLVSPVLASLLREENIIPETATWNGMMEEENTVYLRYHTPLPDVVVTALGAADEGASVKSVGTFVYELFLVPYAADNDTVRAMVRDGDGNVTAYAADIGAKTLTVQELQRFIRSYGRNLFSFLFSDNGEPVFTAPLTVRAITMTDELAEKIPDREEHLRALMNSVGFNPDKVLSTYTEMDGTRGFVDSRGVLYVRRNTWEYQSTADVAISVSDLVGDPGFYGMGTYLRAGAALIASVRAIDRSYMGDDAEILLTGVTAKNGAVILTYHYFFDNTPFADTEPAVVAVFENGYLKEVTMSMMAVNNLGSRLETYTEQWFARYMNTMEQQAENIHLVYRTNFEAEAILPEWRGVVRISNRIPQQ